MDIEWSKYPLATHYTPATDGNFAGFWRMSGDEAVTLWCLELKDGSEAVEYNEPTIFASNRQMMIERPIEWSGIGHPPVGTVCEITTNDGHNWRQVKIIFFDDYVTMIGEVDGQVNREIFKRCDADVAFRPLRTPEQIREEEVQVILDWLIEAHRSHGLTGIAGVLHDEGFMKKVTE